MLSYYLGFSILIEDDIGWSDIPYFHIASMVIPSNLAKTTSQQPQLSFSDLVVKFLEIFDFVW